MPFDREDTLRKAEKLLRQGRLDLAIAEYRTVVEEQPNDLNTANLLGDLYIRAGQIDKAVAQYMRIADHLATEGFLPRASAVFKKILKIKPHEERAMLRLGQISVIQGLLVEARAQFLSLAERQRARGDQRGEAETLIQVGDLEGANFDAQLTGARSRVQLGRINEAVAQFKQLAEDLQQIRRDQDALRLLTEALSLAPADAELRQTLMRAYVARGEYDTARSYAATATELKTIADQLFQHEREDEAIAMLLSAADADPADTGVRARLARLFVRRGDVESARQMLTPEVAGSDLELLWMLAEIELRDGRIEEGTATLQRILQQDPGRRDALVILGCSVAETNVDAGYQCIDVAARAAIDGDEWASAAAAFNEFVNRVPNHIPALMRLVEICVDGGLEATMYSAQAQLADAYLALGAGAEARVIAEDLVAREPWDRTNIERFRRALALLGEGDVDTIIADRLSGQSPFLTTDFSWPSAPVIDTPVVGDYTAAPMPELEVKPPPKAESKPPAKAEPAPPKMKPADAVAAAPAARHQAHEIDLNQALGSLNVAGGATSSKGAAPSIESVLKNVRDEAAKDLSSPEAAEHYYKLASTYLETGMFDEAVGALEVVSRSPRHRFRAAALLAKLFKDRGETVQAIEWFERAADAPAPSPAAAHQLLYELAITLEAQGESVRALAVFLELQSEAGEYRDLAARLERLSKVANL